MEIQDGECATAALYSGSGFSGCSPLSVPAYYSPSPGSVNACLREQGMREIDPSNPQMAERYDLGLAP